MGFKTFKKPVKKEYPYGVFYRRGYIIPKQKEAILQYLAGLKPLWENRFSEHNPPPANDVMRTLKRPVYWLGNWQFACHDYFHPPKGIDFRCVEAEGYPDCLGYIVREIEKLARKTFRPEDVPEKWHLNTCLINFYGSKFENDKWNDQAQVGDHRDFEPGPVASLSFGERAFFQFVRGNSNLPNNVAFEQWVEDSALQMFAGKKFKDELFHRVQRVENKNNLHFPFQIENFKTRRVNFTFRYVPIEYVKPFCDFPQEKKEDVIEYMQNLALSSQHFHNALLKNQKN